MKVLVTGGAGHLGRALLPPLLDHPSVTEVTGIDRQLITFAHPRFQAIRADLRQGGLAALIEGTEALVHLAFVVQRGDLGRRRRNRAYMRDLNLDTARKTATLARDAGVGHFIFISSVAVYGAWPDNPSRLSERSPVRPNPGFAYAEDKAAVETLLHEELSDSGIRVTILRPHAILGPDAQPILLRLLAQRWAPRHPPPEPLIQCIWQDDVVSALLKTLASGTPGTFNLAAEPAMSLAAMKRHLHSKVHTLPYGVMRLAHRALWQFTGKMGEPGWVDALRHSLVVDSGHAHRTLDWHPAKDVPACLEAMRDRLRPVVGAPG